MIYYLCYNCVIIEEGDNDMEEKKTSPKLAIVSVLIATILTGVGVAFGYFIWNSTTNTDISFTVEGATVELSDGKDITGANLMPVSSYTVNNSNVIKKDIKVRLQSQPVNVVTVTMSLKVNSIDSGLNHSSFKYNLVNASGTSVKSGNFATSKAGDTISLLSLSTEDNSLTTSLSSYTLYIYIDGASGDNPSSMMNQSFDFSFDVVGTDSMLEKLSSTSFITKLDDGTTGDSGSGVYKIEHSAIASGSSATGAEIPAVTDYRYYGANPNNYICLDKEGQSTCPDRGLYRIIGSIYEENAGENLIKVIKATPLTNGSTTTYVWDSNYNIWATPTNGNYSNSLTSGASLMILLNSGDWWSGTNTYANYGLTATAKSMVNTSRYYLSGYNNSSVKTTAMYGYERGTNRYNTDRPLYWDGYVGLMYPSDYGYAAGNSCATGTNLSSYDSSCKSKDWLYNSSNWQWLMSPYSDNFGFAWIVYSTGIVGYYSSNDTGLVSPVFYLTSDVNITGGTGTSSDPLIATK